MDNETPTILSRPINPHPTAKGLDPSDVMELRASVRGPLQPDTNQLHAHVRFELDQTGVEGHWAIIQGGLVRARTQWGHVALHVLRCERLRPGYLASLLDPSRDVTEALMDPLTQARRERERGVALATASQRAREADEARSSTMGRIRAEQALKAALSSPNGLSLDDLLDPTKF